MREDRLARTALALLLTTWPAVALAQSASDRVDAGSGGEGRQGALGENPWNRWRAVWISTETGCRSGRLFPGIPR